jgi:hypothetical protein
VCCANKLKEIISQTNTVKFKEEQVKDCKCKSCQEGYQHQMSKKEEENVEFDEFLNAIKTIMLYDTYFEEMQVLFKYLDVKGTGKIVKNHLMYIRQSNYIS